jgi:antitoxin VapB
LVILITVIEGQVVPLQIANPTVVDKVERLAKATGLTKTAAVERAVDQLLRETEGSGGPASKRVDALLAQLDRIPDRPDAFDALEWDQLGLPR